MELGERIAVWRKLWRYSQRELARRAGITNGTLSQIEQGNTSPSVHTVQKLADAFGIGLQTLMFEPPFSPIMVVTEGQAPVNPLSSGSLSIYKFAPVGLRFHRLNLPAKCLIGQSFLDNQISQQAGPISAGLVSTAIDAGSNFPNDVLATFAKQLHLHGQGHGVDLCASRLAPTSRWAMIYSIAGELTVSVAGLKTVLFAGDATCIFRGCEFELSTGAHYSSEILLFSSDFVLSALQVSGGQQGL
jgi:transcriptional regulator with XRE-family HTH domain